MKAFGTPAKHHVEIKNKKRIYNIKEQKKRFLKTKFWVQDSEVAFAAGFQVTIYRKGVFSLAPKDCAATYPSLEPPTQYTAYFMFCILENQLFAQRAQWLLHWEIPIWGHKELKPNKSCWGKALRECGVVLEINSNSRLFFAFFSWKMGIFNQWDVKV